MGAEKKRLEEDKKRTHYWKKWGPYLAERQWGTVREDYSKGGDVWNSFSFDDARLRAYRWGEDGIGGLCDSHQRLCFALSFWNEKDLFLKERMFGLANLQGNHGEDVKEYYYFLDNMPTHSYMKYLYKYPQAAYPYDELKKTNAERSQLEPEYELVDTGIFDHNRYFDIFIEYAKADPEDIFIRITVHNRGNEERPLHVIPTLWVRNIWFDQANRRPQLKEGAHRGQSIAANHPSLGTYVLYGEEGASLLFTDNESSASRGGKARYAKDGINRYVVEQDEEAINPLKEGTKGAFHYLLAVPAHEERKVDLRLTTRAHEKKPLASADKIFKKRRKEADEFYTALFSKQENKEYQAIARQALAGMLWNKLYYYYVPRQWLQGDPAFSPPLPPHDPHTARNKDWGHLFCEDVLSVPDCWEFPALFSWDTAFHTIPLALVDAEFAKQQLSRLTQGWYMHPNGQLPAYEWDFFDVNPPVHAWATWRVYKIEQRLTGVKDRLFLKRVFHKLLLNFTWWVNRKDSEGKNVFQGGFLGLDNISVFNRSEDLPNGASLYQSDATSWMGMFCLNMLTIAFELANGDRAYEDLANKFYNHFLFIARAINFEERGSRSLWDAEDGFYYDVLRLPNGEEKCLKVRSLVGLMPLLAVATLDPETLDRLPSFKRKMEWFLDHRVDLCKKVASMRVPGEQGRKLLAIVDRDKLRKLLNMMLDENEFLSPYGIRSISRYHEAHPFSMEIEGKRYTLDYEPAESTSRLFGGNSNWRGPIWFPINVLIIESLQKFHHYFGEEFKVECPTGSGQMKTLWDVSIDLSERLVRIFERDDQGRRAVFGSCEKFQNDPHFRDYLFFHEYFHGNTGKGLGASHQMGWTGFIAKLIRQLGEYGT